MATPKTIAEATVVDLKDKPVVTKAEVRNYFAGKVVKMDDIVDLAAGGEGKEGGKALNLYIATTLRNEFLEMDENITQRVVCFNEMADQAAGELKKDDFVIFTDASRSARMFKTSKQTIVKTVDIVGRRFQKVTKELLTKLKEKIAPKIISLEDLAFTEADETLLAEAPEEDLASL